MAKLSRIDLPLGDGVAPLTLFKLDSGRTGPCLALIGAVHGDEYEGPLVLSQLIAEAEGLDLTGTLLVLPVANGNAAAAGSRSSPADGKNLARVFPGDAAGSYTQKVADLIYRHVITPADAVLDLHSGGVALASLFFAGYANDPGGVGERALAMAKAFGAPVVWRHDPPQPGGRTMSACSELGKPGVYVEASGGAFPPDEVIAAYRRGVFGVMAHLGLIARNPLAGTGEAHGDPPLQITGSGDLDLTGPAPVSGLCTAHAAPGDRVTKGQLLFSIAGIDGAELVKVTAPGDGLMVFSRRSRWVQKGETLMALAQALPG